MRKFLSKQYLKYKNEVYYLPTLHLIIIVVDIIKENSSQLVRHIPTKASGYDSDGSESARILFFS